MTHHYWKEGDLARIRSDNVVITKDSVVKVTHVAHNLDDASAMTRVVILFGDPKKYRVGGDDEPTHRSYAMHSDHLEPLTDTQEQSND